MSILSIRVKDTLVDQVKTYAKTLKMSQAEYVRHAIEQMNIHVSQQKRKQKLIHASLRTRAESKRVNTEFSDIEHDPEA